MKTEIVEEDGLWILKCKDSGEELDVFTTKEDAEKAQKDDNIESYCL